MSSVPQPFDQGRQTITDTIAGLMAAGSILLSFIAIGFGLIIEVQPRPAVLAPVAAIVAFVAARMSVRYQRLAMIAVFFAMLAWVVGMTLAVITENAII